MPADTAIARWLHDSTASVAADSLAVHLKHYRDAIRGLSCTRRQRDSVSSQLVILAELLDCRKSDKDKERAHLLRDLASALQTPGNQP